MTLHRDLLEQASHQTLRERKRPRQASLRRAVSTAYYALFHLLVTEAAQLLSPAQPVQLKESITRAFNRSQMRDVCDKLARGTGGNPGDMSIPQATRAHLQFPLETDLVRVLQTFVDLQKARHLADYDLSRGWSRQSVLNYVESTEEAFRSWRLVRRTPNASVFLTALLLQKHWTR